MEAIGKTDLLLNPDGSIFHLGLVPDQLADTIIGVGDPGRVERVSRHFDFVEFRKQSREFVAHTGTLDGKRITVLSTGIGTDNVEIFFQEIDALVNVDLKKRERKSDLRALKVIRVGTSGAIQEDIKVGTALLTEQALGLDNLMNFYLLPQSEGESSICKAVQGHARLSFLPYLVNGSSSLLERLGNGLMKGNTVTCPGFYAPQGRRVRLPIRYPDLLNDLGTFRSVDFQLANFEMETAAYFAFGRLLGHETASASVILANRSSNEVAKNPGELVDELITNILERI